MDGDRPIGDFAPVVGAAETNATYRIEDAPYGIGAVTLAAGKTHERFLPLRRWEGSPQSYGLSDSMVMKDALVSPPGYGPEAVNAVNLLIVNSDTGESRWMFAGYDRHIWSEQPLYASEPNATAATDASLRPAVGVILWMQDKDDNHDGKLDEKDHISLYVYRAGTAAPAKFLTGTLIISTRQIGADKFQVVYENGKAAFTATYAVADFKLLSQNPLPKVPK